jgi:membrane protein implicated in regulation of membrane protease activity
MRDLLDAVLIGCFLFGILFTIVSLAFGLADLGSGGDHGAGTADSHGHDGPLTFLSLSSVLAFLTWFGGVGYLVRNGLDWWAPLSLVVGILAGLAGAVAVSWAIGRVLRSSSGVLDPRDYRLVGTIGRVTSSIRSDGYGEIVYEQGGTRHVAAARATDTRPIARDVEVVVLRLERGVAIVQPWDELLAVNDEPLAERAPSLESASGQERDVR